MVFTKQFDLVWGYYIQIDVSFVLLRQTILFSAAYMYLCYV